MTVGPRPVSPVAAPGPAALGTVGPGAARSDGWEPAHALRRALLLGVLLPAVALTLGRPDVLLLAAPLVVGTVLALLAAPARNAEAPAAVARAPRLAGQGGSVPVVVDLAVPPGAQAALVRLPQGDRAPFAVEVGVGPRPGTSTGAAAARRLEGRVLLRRWGRVLVARPDVRAVGPDALLLHAPVPGGETTVRVLPALDRPVPAPLPPRAAGVAGAHRTRRPGEGTDLLDVREFGPGDRMRRIDWRVSARRGSLHVRRTAVDADADVVLALDTRLDVGPRLEHWPRPAGGPQAPTAAGSSLDVTVRTAAGLAQAFLVQGDRLTVLDLSRPRLSCPAGTGRRQLRRVRHRLAEVAVVEGATRVVVRPRAVPPGAVVLLLSPFLDDPPARLAEQLAQRGVQVLAVDVLPVPDLGGLAGRDAVAGRLVLAERRLRLERLGRVGVQVCRGSSAAVARSLRDAARRRQRAGR